MRTFLQASPFAGDVVDEAMGLEGVVVGIGGQLAQQGELVGCALAVAYGAPFADDGPLGELGLDAGVPLLPGLAADPAKLA